MFEAFTALKKAPNLSIQAFLNEFEKSLFKTKPFKTIISGNLLADQLLK